ncbi:MAG: hypothetical protein QW767_02015 [Thermoprotei archaeon]
MVPLLNSNQEEELHTPRNLRQTEDAAPQPDQTSDKSNSREDADSKGIAGKEAVCFVFPSASQLGVILRHISVALRSDALGFRFNSQGIRISQMDMRHVVLAQMYIPSSSLSYYRIDNGSQDLLIRVGAGKWLDRLRMAGNQPVEVTVTPPEFEDSRGYTICFALKNEKMQLFAESFDEENLGEPSFPKPVRATVLLDEFVSALRVFLRWNEQTVTISARESAPSIFLRTGSEGGVFETSVRATKLFLDGGLAVESTYNSTDLAKLVSGVPSAISVSICFGQGSPLIVEHAVPVVYGQGVITLTYYLAPRATET